MINHYIRTHLEDFVEQLYLKHEIFTPAEITISNISRQMNIVVEYTTAKHFKGVSFRAPSGRFIILLDKNRSRQEQRVDFFHELGHLLRHAGNQLVMPDSFLQYQEADTEQFALYALMPFSMLKQLELSSDRKQAIQQIATAFTVGIELASKRFDQILRREFERTMIAETISTSSNPRKEVKSNETKEPQFMVYYDPAGTMDGPSQLVVVLDEWTLMNCREIDLPIGERLPEIDEEDLQDFNGVPVHESDLICFDGKVTLQVHELLYRYDLTKRKFIIQMNRVEMLIAQDQEMTRRLEW
ncbi:ImmA/IrrE family metallo-endopeptidase [Paenibacillus sonchi]|uniref:ImmA/IrrE family metallo-endopeptidase n=1 Tax=Paenibacillus sonchi TaxID=373687 RepID=UPI001E61195E|nr:ImmA/IrrE family metallo-endopeptidase [Paenibacillus sonchi]MCE3203505.1 ImmA/IrrE family metallo-endopeptidase [Paenibacillus sonchi]